MTQLGWIGVWLLVAGGVAILIEAVVMTFWGLALGRRARILAARLETERQLIESDFAKLRLAIAEMERLWRPYHRTLRFLRNPLVIALLQSYRRRAAAR
ncbi:MAG TPA: hypothetical protein VGU71_20515 [Candidatus Dormibacteraeota bacterium]|nr:hypothetical protein [Candidatus Dormibacteraeota bacterium]